MTQDKKLAFYFPTDMALPDYAAACHGLMSGLVAATSFTGTFFASGASEADSMSRPLTFPGVAEMTAHLTAGGKSYTDDMYFAEALWALEVPGVSVYFERNLTPNRTWLVFGAKGALDGTGIDDWAVGQATSGAFGGLMSLRDMGQRRFIHAVWQGGVVDVTMEDRKENQETVLALVRQAGGAVQPIG